MMDGKPLCIEGFCGLGGWSEGAIAEGYTCIGFDIERHDYGTGGYPGTLVLQDMLTVEGIKGFTPSGQPLGKNEPARRWGSKSPARKAASAMIAKIPFALAQYIAAYWKPREAEENTNNINITQVNC